MALVCGASLAGNAGSKLAEGMDDCVFCECCVSSGRSPSDATEQSPIKFLLSVVCLCVILKPQQWGGLRPRRAVEPQGGENVLSTAFQYMNLGASRLSISFSRQPLWMTSSSRLFNSLLRSSHSPTTAGRTRSVYICITFDLLSISEASIPHNYNVRFCLSTDSSPIPFNDRVLMKNTHATWLTPACAS